MSRIRLYAAVLAALVIGVLLTGGATAAVPDPPTITSMPSKLSNESSPKFEFTDTDVTATFECRLDSKNAADFSPCTNPKTFSSPSLLDGPHTFDVRAVN